jgi:hypothetical protein
MRAFTKFAVAAAALTLSFGATAASAAEVIATQTVFGVSGPEFTWTNNGVTGVGAGGTLTGSALGNAANPFLGNTLAFNFLPLAVDGPLAADFSFSGTSTGGPAVFSGATWEQRGLDGSFSFTYVGPTFVATSGTTYTTGSNLLSGTFTNAWIQGGGSSGSTNVTMGNGGSACFTSDYFSVGCGVGSRNEFAFNLLNAQPGFGAQPGKGLNNFTADGNGIFSVPEPGTWALMILGFGSAGAMIRSRRRVATTA